MEKNKIKKVFLAILFLLICVFAFPKAAEAAKLNKNSVLLLKGKTVTLQLKGTKKKAVWKTTRKSIARFMRKKNTSVKVKAYKAGYTTVSARVGKKTYKCKVHVVDPKLNTAAIRLEVGHRKKIVVTGGTGKIKWSSTNPSVATVNASGTVTARNAGTVKIYAIQNRKKLSCKVTVQKTQTQPGTEPGSGDEKKPIEKRVWVVTQEAWIEYVPVYENRRTEWECSCGYKTEIDEEFRDHKYNNLTDEHARSWLNTIWDSMHYEEIYHEESGYWKIEYVYE